MSNITTKARKAIQDPTRIPHYLKERVYEDIYLAPRLEGLSKSPIGKQIFDEEWELLIVLDTCRVDALREVADEYEFLSEIDQVTSIGSSTLEWISQTFVEEHRQKIQNTGYVVCNGWSKRILQEGVGPEDHHFGRLGNWLASPDWTTVGDDAFQTLDFVYDYTESDLRSIDSGGGKGVERHPRYTTDRAISVADHESPERLVVHYQEPHSPYIADALAEDRKLKFHESDPWEFLKTGGSKDVVWDSYLADLRLVLDEVELLLDNVDADQAVITADHGEAFGEADTYGHGAAHFHPYIRSVPWVITSAEDRGDYEPELESRDADERDVGEMLQDMGYL
jgi:hypothetical protein